MVEVMSSGTVRGLFGVSRRGYILMLRLGVVLGVEGKRLLKG